MDRNQRDWRSLWRIDRIHSFATFLCAAIMASDLGVAIVSWILLAVACIQLPDYWAHVLRCAASQELKLDRCQAKRGKLVRSRQLPKQKYLLGARCNNAGAGLSPSLRFGRRLSPAMGNPYNRREICFRTLTVTLFRMELRRTSWRHPTSCAGVPCACRPCLDRRDVC